MEKDDGVMKKKKEEEENVNCKEQVVWLWGNKESVIMQFYGECVIVLVCNFAWTKPTCRSAKVSHPKKLSFHFQFPLMSAGHRRKYTVFFKI